jgi:hypothetical protein
MVTIDVRADFPDVKRLLGEQQRQMPFAVALALTRTAQDVRKAEQVEMRSVFDRPTPFTLNALFVKPATKATLTAEVWVKDSERPNHYLLPQIGGGDRPLKRFEQLLVQRGLMRAGERAVPGGGATRDSYGNVSRGQIVKILSQLQAFNLAGSTANASGAKRSKGKRAREAYFVSTGAGTHPFGRRSWRNGRMQQTLPRGVWVRRPHGVLGSTVAPVLLFVSKATYRKRFRFDEVALSTIARVLPGHVDAAVARALATARPSSGAA